ncbi:MAG: cytochrome c4 [Sedimenticola sp.]|uniref:Cytochrome c4 n=1 Tax=Sedimenticola thiotaurini TaxID=1543721 RepID=A0A558DAK3_9GAMM|nr:cytochrome c4 [Sedimenticola sp.]MCW8974757.1 cytochrome c4 [Sedimenticola sp.]MCW9022560.1 cytochrome c4 [Sedimenticola sp.]TVT57993.1 MAG: cytochrome c4 [Sedimenticola thiotaurini]
MNKWLVSVSIVLAMVVVNAQAAGDAAAGKTKSATCLACHGADGNSANAVWPKLAGQHPNYIKKQLQEFKAGARKNDLMSPMAMPLSDQDMDDLAAYFSSQTQAPGTATADSVELGGKIYRAGNASTNVAACMACHGPTGSGNPSAKFPRISGQHAAYIEKTLKDFRSGDRTNDNAKMMQNVVFRMTDKEIAAVAQYLQGLR